MSLSRAYSCSTAVNSYFSPPSLPLPRAATLTYEEVEKETTTTPNEPKRRGRPPKTDKLTPNLIPNPNSNKRARDEDEVDEPVRPHRGEVPAAAPITYGRGGAKAAKPAAPSSSSSSSSSHAHYPSIPFAYNAPGGKNKPHAALLAHAVARACEAEAQGLEAFFQSHPGTGQAALLGTLRRLPFSPRSMPPTPPNPPPLPLTYKSRISHQMQAR